jgi:two-component system sensor histidine kinase HydH
LNNVISLVSSEARKREITLECLIAKLPAIEGDPEKLRQAFLNIILNGLQASPPGGSFTITAREVPDVKGPAWVELLFADSGPGIPPAETENIFEPFFTTKDGGTGLGLAITRKIIEGHGGSIRVESKPGSGAKFHIRLPVKSE